MRKSVHICIFKWSQANSVQKEQFTKKECWSADPWLPCRVDLHHFQNYTFILKNFSVKNALSVYGVSLLNALLSIFSYFF